MESLDLLNLRAGECSFLEIALADVRRYITTFVLENQKEVVLVFPPVSARNRFLIHTLVQNFFNELRTISIGNSYGRRTVVFHSSLIPMLRETEIEESSTTLNENDACMHRAYRTPSERAAQEKLFQSLMPRKKVDKSARSTQRKQSKRPDIPIYVPKARRSLPYNTIPSVKTTTNSSNITPHFKLEAISVMVDDSSVQFNDSLNDSSLPINFNNQQKNNILTPINSSQHEDLKNETLVSKIDTVIQTSNEEISSQISEPLSSSYVSDLKNPNESNVNLSVSNEKIEIENCALRINQSESKRETILSKNCDNDTINPSLSECLSNSTSCIQNCSSVDLLDSQVSGINNAIITDDILLTQKISDINNAKAVDIIGMTNNENIINTSFEQEQKIYLGDKVIDSGVNEIKLESELYDNCPSCLDDSFTSATDKEDTISSTLNEESTILQNSESVNKPQDNVENNKKKNTKKKKTKKKVLDVDECSWEDLYDKEDDYIHPLLMKELISSMGKVQVKCAKEDYRNYQTIEERSGDGECVIEVYGFSSDLKTIDLMNQFAAFRKQKFEIIWVDDTHALAVFESPQLADRALNTPFALVKTRPLKNAIRESKLKAETVAPLPATRPKTCTAMARRLVSSALGLKVNVSPALLNAERTLLANAKEKKIRDAQQKHNIWNDL